METSDSLKHLTPIARLLIPYYEEKYKIRISSNLIMHSQAITKLRQEIHARIKLMPTSEIEFARFLRLN